MPKHGRFSASSFLARLFSRALAPAPPASSRPHSQLASGHSQHSRGAQASDNASRRELLRVVLRETLNRHGIPADWLGADLLVATSRTGERGLHWRLVVRHWDPRLLTHGFALQQSLIKRMTTYDPLAGNWLMGISWQFALPDEFISPPMPHPGLWTADPPTPRPTPLQAVSGGLANVIAGPVRIADHASPAAGVGSDVRADLDQLLAVRDRDFKQHREGAPDHEATQPMFLRTQPSRLE